MFDGIKRVFAKRSGGGSAASGSDLRDLTPVVQVSAATDLPTPETPKVKNKQQVLPSYLKTANPNPDSALTATDRRLINTDLTTLRQGANTRKIIRDFVRSSPDLSAAITAYVRTGITSGYTAVAKNPDGSFNPEGTATLAQMITRLNILNDYSIGYDDSLSIRGLSETWARELLMNGAMAGELVLDKARLPDKMQPISIEQIRLYPSRDGKKMVPTQFLAGTEISLDIPTFFMVYLDQDTLEAYPISPIEPALQAVLFSIDFMNDIRRIVKKAIHPRVVVSIDEDKFYKSLPPDIKNDSDKLTEHLNQVIADVAEQINGLEPEDALVVFDSIGIDIQDHGNTNLSNEYTVIQEMADAKMATGAKVMPTLLGKSSGTSNVASAEVLVFMKYVEGTVWSKLNEMFSKMFTLGLRLLGLDVYVEFSYNSIDLRPDSELESFRAVKQSRILELLSLGLMGDDEASVILTGHLPPAGYKPLTGTGFRANTSVEPAGDGYNGASNSGSTTNQNLERGKPGAPKSQNKGKATADLHVLTAV